MKREDVLNILREHLPDLRAQFGVQSLALFGSLARGEATAASDVDILVELDRLITLFDLVALEQRLAHLLGVPKVDVVLRDCIYPELKDSILEDAIHVG